MAETEAIVQQSQEELSRVGVAEIVLAIPTYNNRETIGRVAEAGIAGLLERSPSLRAAIINPDGHSQDGTPDLLKEIVGDRIPLIRIQYPVYPVHRMSAPLAGVPGRTEALDATFAVARTLGARVCAIIDAELKTPTPDWVERLAAPVLDHSIDLVAPFYLRHKFDGMIHTGIVYPFTRALWGKRVRQALGADLAFSRRLIEYYASREKPEGQVSTPMDPWSAVPAIVGGYQIGQVFLGPRDVEPREVAPELSVTLVQVLTSLFDQMEATVPFWQRVRGTDPVPWFGPPPQVKDDPMQVNVKRMRDSYRLGLNDLQEIWAKVFAPATLWELRKSSRMPEESFRISDEAWARTVYDFALAYHHRPIGREHLLRALTPLYLGWVASFIGELQDASHIEVEDRIERLAHHFDTEKRYLISRWRWPDKFNP